MTDATNTTSSPETESHKGVIDTARETAGQMGEQPLALLAGGIAIGALVGTLLPRHPREKEMLQPLGRRIAEGATAAAQAAKEAGKAELDQLLPDREGARNRVAHVLESAVGAAKGAAAG